MYYLNAIQLSATAYGQNPSGVISEPKKIE